MKRFAFAAITAWLALSCAARVGAQQLTVNVNVNGQPASGVSVVFMAANLIKTPSPQAGAADNNALNLGNMLKTRTATTNASGTGVLDLGNIIKSHGQTEVQIVVRVCKDGKNVVYILQKGQTVPPQDEKCVNTNDCKCKDQPGGLFLIADGDIVNINITPETVDVHVTHAGSSAVAFSRLISIEAEGGVGFKNLGGTKGEALPGGTFSTPSPTTFSGDVGAAIYIGPISLADSFYAANSISSKGGTSLPTGGTDTVNVNRTFRGDTLTAGARIPLGGKFSLLVHGGGNFWHVSIDTRETVSGGTTGSTTSNSRSVDGTGWTVGGAVQVKISGRWSVLAGYDYLPMNNAGVNVHLNEGVFGVTYRIR